MINVLFLFPKSADPKELDDLFSSRFNLESKQAMKARSLTISVGELMSPFGPPPFVRVMEVSYDSLEDVMGVTQNPDVQAGNQKLKAFGVLILMYEVNEA